GPLGPVPARAFHGLPARAVPHPLGVDQHPVQVEDHALDHGLAIHARRDYRYGALTGEPEHPHQPFRLPERPPRERARRARAHRKVSGSLQQRIASLPWDELLATLDRQGFAQTPVLLSAGECSTLAALYESGSFRSTVVMGRRRFGEGEYRYFADPLPA